MTIKSISEWNNQKAAWPIIKEYGKQVLTYDWVFSRWYEKLILGAAVLYSFYSIIIKVFL